MMQALASDIENAIAYLTTKKTCEVRVLAGRRPFYVMCTYAPSPPLGSLLPCWSSYKRFNTFC